MASSPAATYNPHFSPGPGTGSGIPCAGAPPGPASYNLPSSSMLGSMFSSVSPLATCGTAHLNPSMNLLPTVSNVLIAIRDMCLN